MRYSHGLTGSLMLALIVTACGNETAPSESGGRASSNSSNAPSTVEAPRWLAAEDYDPALFEGTAGVENRWFPLRPGTRLTYRGSSLDEGKRVRHSVDMIVTDLVKIIDGIPNAVIWERDYTEGELVEAELAFFAVDQYRNVWHTGEYPEEYDAGRIDKTPAWIHGVKGATAGITLPGQPRVGTPDFAQGFAPPPLNWVDRGRVYKTEQRVCVPAGCYNDVVVIEEFEKGLQDAYQDKHYAPGIGVVRVSWRGSKDEDKEILRLVRMAHLSRAEMAEARAAALEQEERAYRLSKHVYGATAPAQPTP